MFHNQTNINTSSGDHHMPIPNCVTRQFLWLKIKEIQTKMTIITFHADPLLFCWRIVDKQTCCAGDPFVWLENISIGSWMVMEIVNRKWRQSQRQKNDTKQIDLHTPCLKSRMGIVAFPDHFFLFYLWKRKRIWTSLQALLVMTPLKMLIICIINVSFHVVFKNIEIFKHLSIVVNNIVGSYSTNQW